MATVGIFPFVVKVSNAQGRPFTTLVFATTAMEAERVTMAQYPFGKLQSRPKKVTYAELTGLSDQRPAVTTSGSQANVGP